MALNKYMHPRNIYKSRKPDFKALAIKYEYFRENVKQNLSGMIVLDFKEPSALRALTRALLEDDFGLTVSLPIDRLIPTVPQRLNYILWLEDMLGENKEARGIDIGTGASCIYPLLGFRQNGWQFLASDIDDQNIHFAKKNVEQNKMEDKIEIKKVTDDTILLGLVEDNVQYDFCMCNPPFFTDHLEAQGISNTRGDERPEPHSVSTASEGESIAWGGEVRFLTQMIEESLVLKHKVRVYTSLLGKKISLSVLKDILIAKKISQFSTTEFCQGRTMRWGLAWTFDDTVQFPKSSFKQEKNKKPPVTYEIPRTATTVTEYTVQAYTTFVREQLEELKINYYVKHSGKFYTCLLIQAQVNTWSNQRRKRRQKQSSASQVHTESSSKGDVGVDKTIADDMNTATSQNSVEGEIQKVIKSNATNNSDKSEIKSESDVNIEGKNVTDKTTTQTDNDHEERESVVSSEKTDLCLATADLDNAGDRMEVSDATSVRKRTNNSEDSGTECKRLKTDSNSDNTDEIDGNQIELDKIDNDTIKDKTVSLEEGFNTQKVLEKKPIKGQPSFLVRKDIVEQFWHEQEQNTEKAKGKSKVPKSIYEKLEPFDESEDCLLLCKMVVRKDEGVMTFILTHLHGNKEAMHQVMQYFKNKFLAK